MSTRGAVPLIVLAVLLAISVGVAVKLHLDRSALAQAFDRYAALAPGPPAEGPPEVQQIAAALQGARTSVANGAYRAALQELAAVESPPSPRAGPTGEAPRPGPRGRPGPEGGPRIPGFGAAERAPRGPLNITPKALQFLREHKELDRKALRVTRLGSFRKEQGQDVSEGRKFFARAMEAAERGDGKAVGRYLDKSIEAMGGFPKEMRGREGRGAARSPFEEIMGRLGEATEEAAKRGRDVSRLRELMEQLRQAGQERDEKRARELIAQAQQELRKQERGRPRPGARRPSPGRRVARRGPPGRRPPGGERPGEGRFGPPGPQAGLLYFFREVLTTMRAEDGLLGSIGEHLFNAKRMLRENNQEQVGEVLTEAEGDLSGITKGRVRLAALTREPPPGPGRRMGPGRPGEGPGRIRPPRLPDMADLEFLPYNPDEAREKITALLDEVHGMSDIDYAAAREDLWQELLERIAVRPRPPEPEPTEAPPIPGRAVTEEDVRARLLMAEEPFKERREQGEDVSEVAAKLAEARKLLYEGEYERAIAFVNGALEMLGVTVEPAPNREEESDVLEGEAPTSEEESEPQ